MRKRNKINMVYLVLSLNQGSQATSMNISCKFTP